MGEDKPKYYIERFIENSEEVKNKSIEDKKIFHDLDHLSSFFHNLVSSIDIIWNEEQNKKLNPYFEQIIEECFLEIAKECENFICMLINGFYDGAIKSLRHILENFIIHLYFSTLSKSKNLKTFYVKRAEFYKLSEQLTKDERIRVEDYKENGKIPLGDFPIYEANAFFCWKQGKQYLESYNFILDKPILKDFPKLKECLDLIFKQDNFKQNIKLKDEIYNLYREFSKILHNRGTISQYRTASSSQNNFFNKEDLQKSIQLYKKVEELISISLLLGGFPNFKENSFTYVPRYREVKKQKDST